MSEQPRALVRRGGSITSSAGKKRHFLVACLVQSMNYGADLSVDNLNSCSLVSYQTARNPLVLRT